MQEDKKKKKPRRFNLLIVPEGKGEVKQFHVALDFVIILSAIIIFLLVLGVSYIVKTFGEIEDDRNQILALTAQLEYVTSSNIILQAENEELQNDLLTAQTYLETKDYVEQQADSASALSYIPTGLPITGQVSQPSDFDEAKGYITFTVGDGTKIAAAGDGTVSKVVSDTDYGYRVEIDHGNDYVSIYRYRFEPLLTEGTQVLRGTAIFSCTSVEPQFTYEIQYKGKSIDPNTFMKIDG
ncbi:MAG: M23 family metallopeptidase [Lachnospiraceae bacterium]|nr:M23 family metallopeptidase [Lachnospiraceae bacterium]